MSRVRAAQQEDASKTNAYVFIPQALRDAFRSRINRWLDSMAPSATTHELTRKNVYIFPNLRGFGYLIVNMVLWLIGTNYQNNLVLAAAFFMAALFVVAILHTYLNLKDLEVTVKGAAPVFAGDSAHFLVKLKNTTARQFENIELYWQYNPQGEAAINIPAQESAVAEVAFPAPKRGWLTPGRLCIQTTYPLGMLRCWTWLNFDCKALVYPQPIEIPPPNSREIEGDKEAEHPIKGGEDFSGLDRYRPGDALRNIAWKASARGKGLFVKEYSQNESCEIWLDYFSALAMDMEAKLSGLCYWAIEYDKLNENYGLHLPGIKIEPASGDAHTQRVLTALAEFDTHYNTAGRG